MVQILKKSQIVFLSIVTLFRIFLSQWIGNWYPSSQTFDDYILVTYANITEHFRTPNINSLIKDMGYPLFLDFVHLTGLSYSTINNLGDCSHLNGKIIQQIWFATYFSNFYIPFCFIYSLCIRLLCWYKTLSKFYNCTFSLYCFCAYAYSDCRCFEE